MATITEDYVSFEIAKLLKEKGFDETCYACYEYFSSSITMYSGYSFEYKGEPVHSSKNIVKCPTTQMVMKWLRERYNLSVEVYRTACGYVGCIVSIPSGTDIKFLEETGDDLSSGQYTKWEYACKAAIKYCLEHIIYLEKFK